MFLKLQKIVRKKHHIFVGTKDNKYMIVNKERFYKR